MEKTEEKAKAPTKKKRESKIRPFFKNVKDQWSKIIWPERREALWGLFAVAAASFVISALIAGADTAFDWFVHLMPDLLSVPVAGTFLSAAMIIVSIALFSCILFLENETSGAFSAPKAGSGRYTGSFQKGLEKACAVLTALLIILALIM